MSNRLKLVFIGLAAVMAQIMAPAYAQALDAKNTVCEGANYATSSGTTCDSTSAGSINTTIRTAVRIMQVVAGVLAVFYMVYAGVKFVTSGGSSDGVKSAKNTILYATIGLVVVILAEAITQYVLKRFN